VIYNASIVNFYNATGSLACFENKNILFYFEKRWNCSCKFKSRKTINLIFAANLQTSPKIVITTLVFKQNANFFAQKLANVA
jgi:hypothetical protein